MERRVAWLLVALLCGAALAQGLLTVSGLEWPGEPDLFRDIAQAQTFADGGWQADPFYRGETLWYNPLVPGMVAAAAKITGVAVHTLYVELGPPLNLLGPIGLAVLAATLFGSRAAAASLVAFLFLRHPRLPAWESATYSPWLLAGVFSQGLFYLTLALYVRIRSSARSAPFMLAGLCAGITFLGHTAPAVVLAAVIGVDTLLSLRRSGDVSSRLGLIRRLATMVTLPWS
jgi:hypothetical protein